jgi:hypothetical protein
MDAQPAAVARLDVGANGAAATSMVTLHQETDDPRPQAPLNRVATATQRTTRRDSYAGREINGERATDAVVKGDGALAPPSSSRSITARERCSPSTLLVLLARLGYGSLTSVDEADGERGGPVVPLLLFLVVVILLFGVGAAVHALWWIAIVALVLWLVGFAVRPGGRGRWYYW